MTQKHLRLFSGAAYDYRKVDDKRWPVDASSPHIFVAAYSIEDARRLVHEYCGRSPSRGEIRDYWSKAWGDRCKDIKPHRGVWFAFDHYSAPTLFHDGRTPEEIAESQRKRLCANPKPCEACPYRKDCPPNLWDAGEYFKLVRYDDSDDTPPVGVFMCHDGDGKQTVCKGWLDVHGSDQLSIRFAGASGVDIAALRSSPKTSVPLFASGREAALHGITGSHIQKPPGRRAADKLKRLQRRHERLRGGDGK